MPRYDQINQSSIDYSMRVISAIFDIVLSPLITVLAALLGFALGIWMTYDFWLSIFRQ